MFHIHVLGATEATWLSSYDGSDYSNHVMGEWFGLYRSPIKLFIIYINHPMHPR